MPDSKDSRTPLRRALRVNPEVLHHLKEYLQQRVDLSLSQYKAARSWDVVLKIQASQDELEAIMYDLFGEVTTNANE